MNISSPTLQAGSWISMRQRRDGNLSFFLKAFKLSCFFFFKSHTHPRITGLPIWNMSIGNKSAWAFPRHLKAKIQLNPPSDFLFYDEIHNNHGVIPLQLLHCLLRGGKDFDFLLWDRMKLALKMQSCETRTHLSSNSWGFVGLPDTITVMLTLKNTSNRTAGVETQARISMSVVCQRSGPLCNI